MEPRIDEMVLTVQKWLNENYDNDSRFNHVTENGKTGWDTIYGLRRALQIELGIENTSDSFGPTTYSLCPNVNQGEESNIVSIIQGGLWCKGYNPGGFNGYYGNGTYAAVKKLKADMGFSTASGNMNRDIMRALLDMSAFVIVGTETEEKQAIRTIQQQLNYDYYDYYQICPCDGLYNREMNKMLIYALQKELGISKNSATGTWGPTTTNLCKQKVFNVGASDPIIKLVRYATVCNGFSVSVNSSSFDSNLDNVLDDFAHSLLIPKQNNKINYTVIKSLLSSNGDTSRSAKGCDTATKLNSEQIQTIKNEGYEIIGRYLTNTPGGTLDKCLTNTEIARIFDAGLKIFPIFQETGRSVANFNSSTGFENGVKAFEAAEKFGMSHGSTIYFAVDFDPTDAEITSGIIPYFASIKLSSLGRKYRVGVYGTRNVCNRLNNEIGIDKFFVLDASYGFSGNLGFTMPNKWCFDQFATDITIGSGSGQVDIDKVAVSNRDKGINQTNSYIKNKVLDFAKGFDLDDQIDISADFETDVIQVLERGANGQFITFMLTHGVSYNPDAGIHFNNEGELLAQLADLFSNNSSLNGASDELKTNIIASIEGFGFSVESGNLEVTMMTDMDRYNPGLVVQFAQTIPFTSDETSYARVSMTFKYPGNVSFDMSTVPDEVLQAVGVASVITIAGIAAIFGWSLLTPLFATLGTSYSGSFAGAMTAYLATICN